jgi:sugar phosphate isomerase/epimerase
MVVLSCSTRSFPNTPLDGVLARVAWAGFQAVELFQPANMPLPHAAALGELLQSADLPLAAIHAGVLGGEEEEARLEAAAHVGRCALVARELQCNRVVCDLELDSEVVAQETVARLLAALGELPVLVCLRNRPEDGPEAMDALMRLVVAEPDRLGLAFDPGAAARAGWDPLQAWPYIAAAVRHLYATDAAGARPAALGAGEVPWEDLAERVRGAGYSGAVSLWREPGQAYSDPVFAEAEIKVARALLESWFTGVD